MWIATSESFDAGLAKFLEIMILQMGWGYSTEVRADVMIWRYGP